MRQALTVERARSFHCAAAFLVGLLVGLPFSKSVSIGGHQTRFENPEVLPPKGLQRSQRVRLMKRFETSRLPAGVCFLSFFEASFEEAFYLHFVGGAQTRHKRPWDF